MSSRIGVNPIRLIAAPTNDMKAKATVRDTQPGSAVVTS
jgi:hypothetical protein